jgi:hypothetical protein
MTLLFANSVGCVLLSAVEVAMALTSELHPTHQIPRREEPVRVDSNLAEVHKPFRFPVFKYSVALH